MSFNVGNKDIIIKSNACALVEPFRIKCYKRNGNFYGRRVSNMKTVSGVT